MAEPTPTDAAMEPCGDCGMPCAQGEYHPYAACLMFKACHNSETVRANLNAVRAQPAPAASQKPPTQVQAGAVPLTERQIAQCIVSAGCVGTVKMSFESGPYSIDRPTLNATKLVQSIEAAHGIGIKGGRNVDHPV